MESTATKVYMTACFVFEILACYPLQMILATVPGARAYTLQFNTEYDDSAAHLRIRGNGSCLHHPIECWFVVSDHDPVLAPVQKGLAVDKPQNLWC